MSGAVLSPAAMAKAAQVAPCPGCAVLAEIRRARDMGAQAKADKLSRSPAVRAVYVHTCERYKA
jgi:hypothetical protein